MDAYVFSIDGLAIGPTKITASDVAQALPAAILVNAENGQLAIAVVITCEDNPIRYSFGVTPTQAGLGHILYPAGSLKISNSASVSSFRFINHTNAANAVIQVTGEYER